MSDQPNRCAELLAELCCWYAPELALSPEHLAQHPHREWPGLLAAIAELNQKYVIQALPVIRAVAYERPALGTSHYRVEIHLGSHHFQHTGGEMTEAEALQIVKELKGH